MLAFTPAEINWNPLQKSLEKLSKGYVRIDGFYPSSLQYCLKISVSEKESIQNKQKPVIKKTLETLAPFLKPLPVDRVLKLNGKKIESFKCINIMENSLCEHYRYSLVEIEGEWNILRQTGSSASLLLEKSVSLDEALDYIGTNLPYE